MNAVPDMSKIEKELVRLQKQKDSVMDLSREVVRLCGTAITQMHAKKLRDADRNVKRLAILISKLKKTEKGFEYHSLQAHQEYVEARAFYTILKDRRLVSPREIGAGEIAYLLGVMDLVGELKREAIDAIRERRKEDANAYYGFMRGIYDSTRGMRFANSLVPEFRRKQDTARIQIETTAGELLAL